MNDASIEFNKQLELDVMISGLTEITDNYVGTFAWPKFDEIVIPEGVKSIGGYAFYICNELTRLWIPASVTKIDLYAFYDCKHLLNVTFVGKTRQEVIRMKDYPWCISPGKICCVQDI